MRCIAPDGADAVLVVPSLGGRRPPPHPLHGVLARVPALPPVLDCLAAGSGAVDHRRAALDGVTCTRSLAGLRVLVADDTSTSGAHLPSAVAAAAAAGATVVGGLVVARFVRGGRASGEALLALARSRAWDPARCVRRTGRQGARHPALPGRAPVTRTTPAATSEGGAGPPGDGDGK